MLRPGQMAIDRRNHPSLRLRCEQRFHVSLVGVTAPPSALDPGGFTTGLGAAEAASRLAADGPNELPVPRARPAILRLAGDLVHAFALMLWVAAGLAWIAGLLALDSRDLRSRRAQRRIRVRAGGARRTRSGSPATVDAYSSERET